MDPIPLHIAMDTTQSRPSGPQNMATLHKEQQFSIQSMLSPPESKRHEMFSSPVSMKGTNMSRTSSASSFSQEVHRQSIPQAKSNATTSLLLSPPISPYTSQTQEMDKDEVMGAKDFPLFPRTDSANGEDGLLFPLNGNAGSSQARDAAIADCLARNAGLAATPTAEEYAIVADSLSNLKFTSVVYREYNKDPRAWYQAEVARWGWYGKRAVSDRESAASKKKLVSPMYRKLAPAPFGRVTKARAPLPRIRQNPKPKRTPPTKVYDDFTNSFPLSPATPTAKTTPKAATSRDDVDYDALEDFSPPINSIGNGSKFKTDWKGSVLDLSNDPDRDLLHEAEINVAATLRLSCATYLCQKRRIFIKRREAYKIGKEFRKTDAQQACKIDVNKASKLWTVFDKAGWFSDNWVR